LLPSRSYITQHVNIDEGLCSPNKWCRPSGSEKKWISLKTKERRGEKKNRQKNSHPPNRQPSRKKVRLSYQQTGQRGGGRERKRKRPVIVAVVMAAFHEPVGNSYGVS
jgi:hypothetical protein